MPKRSNIPEKILSILFKNPAVTREELSKQLGISYQSVQKHLLILLTQEIVVPSFTVAETKIKKQYRFWIFIETRFPEQDGKQHDYQQKLCDEIVKSFQEGENSKLVDGLIFGGIDIVIGGNPDIILRLLTDDPNIVGNYVTRFLRVQPAVVSTSTAWSLRGSSIEKI